MKFRNDLTISHLTPFCPSDSNLEEKKSIRLSLGKLGSVLSFLAVISRCTLFQTPAEISQKAAASLEVQPQAGTFK